jgi:dihydroorotase-like cyclic amidohydrolase
MFGLYPRKGAIRVGADADFAIADLEARWKITPDRLLYKCPWSPNEGTDVRGEIVHTIVRGATVYRDGDLVGQPGAGAFLHGMELAEELESAHRRGVEVMSR